MQGHHAQYPRTDSTATPAVIAYYSQRVPPGVSFADDVARGGVRWASRNGVTIGYITNNGRGHFVPFSMGHPVRQPIPPVQYEPSSPSAPSQSGPGTPSALAECRPEHAAPQDTYPRVPRYAPPPLVYQQLKSAFPGMRPSPPQRGPLFYQQAQQHVPPAGQYPPGQQQRQQYQSQRQYQQEPQPQQHQHRQQPQEAQYQGQPQDQRQQQYNQHQQHHLASRQSQSQPQGPTMPQQWQPSGPDMHQYQSRVPSRASTTRQRPAETSCETRAHCAIQAPSRASSQPRPDSSAGCQADTPETSSSVPFGPKKRRGRPPSANPARPKNKGPDLVHVPGTTKDIRVKLDRLPGEDVATHRSRELDETNRQHCLRLNMSWEEYNAGSRKKGRPRKVATVEVEDEVEEAEEGEVEDMGRVEEPVVPVRRRQRQQQGQPLLPTPDPTGFASSSVMPSSPGTTPFAVGMSASPAASAAAAFPALDETVNTVPIIATPPVAAYIPLAFPRVFHPPQFSGIQGLTEDALLGAVIPPRPLVVPPTPYLSSVPLPDQDPQDPEQPATTPMPGLPPSPPPETEGDEMAVYTPSRMEDFPASGLHLEGMGGSIPSESQEIDATPTSVGQRKRRMTEDSDLPSPKRQRQVQREVTPTHGRTRDRIERAVTSSPLSSPPPSTADSPVSETCYAPSSDSVSEAPSDLFSTWTNSSPETTPSPAPAPAAAPVSPAGTYYNALGLPCILQAPPPVGNYIAPSDVMRRPPATPSLGYGWKSQLSWDSDSDSDSDTGSVDGRGMHVDSEWDSELDAEGEVDEDYEQVTEAEVAPVAAAVSPAEREGTLANLPPLCTFPYGYTFAAQYGTAAETPADGDRADLLGHGSIPRAARGRRL